MNLKCDLNVYIQPQCFESSVYSMVLFLMYRSNFRFCRKEILCFENSRGYFLYIFHWKLLTHQQVCMNVKIFMKIFFPILKFIESSIKFHLNLKCDVNVYIQPQCFESSIYSMVLFLKCIDLILDFVGKKFCVLKIAVVISFIYSTENF